MSLSKLHGFFSRKTLVAILSMVFNLALIAGGIISFWQYFENLSTKDGVVSEINEDQMLSDLPAQYGVVDLAGQVKNPGIYDIKRGDRLINLIEKAGGFSNDADHYFISTCMNLSVFAHDQQKLN